MKSSVRLQRATCGSVGSVRGKSFLIRTTLFITGKVYTKVAGRWLFLFRPDYSSISTAPITYVGIQGNHGTGPTGWFKPSPDGREA